MLAANADEEAGDFEEMCRKLNLGRLQFVELEERFSIADSDRVAFFDPLKAKVQECIADGRLKDE